MKHDISPKHFSLLLLAAIVVAIVCAAWVYECARADFSGKYSTLSQITAD